MYEKECISVNLSRCVQPIFEISSVQLNKAVDEYTDNDMNAAIDHAQKMAIATIECTYHNTKDEDCLTCDEMHKVKKALQAIEICHTLKTNTRLAPLK